MNWPAIYLISIMAAAAAGVAGGIKWRSMEYDRQELERRQGWSDALEATAKELAKLKVEHRTINGRIERIIEKDIQYKECKNSPETMELLNQAARNSK